MSENKNTVSATLKMIKGSPYKLNLVADLIRGKDVESALNELTFSTKRRSIDMQKLLNSAIANAENNNGLDIDNLYVERVDVGKSMMLKRVRARARGRAFRVHKHYSKITITVAEKEA